MLALAFLFIPVSSYGAFDNPGLSNQLLVETGGYDFTVTTLSTFDIDTLEFERDSKQLSLFFNTAATDKVMEITIPGNLIGGTLSFYLNDFLITPKILHHGADDAFAMVSFSGKGEYRLDVILQEPRICQSLEHHCMFLQLHLPSWQYVLDTVVLF